MKQKVVMSSIAILLVERYLFYGGTNDKSHYLIIEMLFNMFNLQT